MAVDRVIVPGLCIGALGTAAVFALKSRQAQDVASTAEALQLAKMWLSTAVVMALTNQALCWLEQLRGILLEQMTSKQRANLRIAVALGWLLMLGLNGAHCLMAAQILMALAVLLSAFCTHACSSEKCASKSRSSSETAAIDTTVSVPLPLSQTKKEYSGKFAIVGAGIRFPGGIETAEDFWETLIHKQCVTGPASARKWNASRWTSKTSQVGKINTNVIGEVAGSDLFDNAYFRISVREAQIMDPQQRQFLLCTAWALEDAGIPQEKVYGSNTGVYIGSSYMVAYLKLQLADPTVITAHTLPGSALCVIANRVSYVYGMMGPSMAIDTACASSLTVLDVAIQAIQNGDCNMAIIGGVNPVINPEISVGYAQLGVLASDGKCKSFSDDANGYCRAEGYGALVIKRLEDAIDDGDHIYSVVCSCSSNANGATSDSITKPSNEAQAALIQHTWAKAQLDLTLADYVEAHGTGTSVGDPIEANGLAQTFGAARIQAGLGPLPFGSCKSNIGHMEPAAGIASLIKTALMIKHRKLLPNANFTKLHRDIPSHLVYVPETVTDLPANKQLTFGINAFGFGGSNSHAIIQEYIPDQRAKTGVTKNLGWRFGVAGPAGELTLVPLSAASEDSLQEIARQWLRVRIADYDAASVLSWKSLRTTHHRFRACVLADSSEQFLTNAEKYSSGAGCTDVIVGKAVDLSTRSMAFVFSGQGPQHQRMGYELYQKEPVFREYIQRCDKYFRAASGFSFLEKTGLFITTTSNAAMDRPDIAQPAICFFQVAMYHQLLCWGVKPQSIVGHSVGEVAAAYAAGAFDLPTTMRLIYTRSTEQQKLEGCGKMLAVSVAAGEILEIIQRRGLQNVYIAAKNSPKSVTVAGIEREITQLKTLCKEKYNIRSGVLGVACAYHTCLMDPIEHSLKEKLSFLQHSLTSRPDGPALYSTVTGNRIDPSTLNGEYWWQNVGLPVEFDQAIRSIIEQQNPCMFVELAPRNVLGSLIQQTIVDAKSDAVVVSTNDKNFDDPKQHIVALAELYVRGVPLEWRNIYGFPQGKPTLPKYPFKQDLAWSEGEINRQNRIGQPYLPFVDTRGIVSTSMYPWLSGHVLQNCPVFPGTGYLEFITENIHGESTKTPFVLQDVLFSRPLAFPGDEKQQLRLNRRAGDLFEVVVDNHTHCSGKVGAPVLSFLQCSKSSFTLNDLNALVADPAAKLTHMSEDDFYGLCQDMGFTYTSLHRAVRDVWKGDEFAVYTVDTEGQLTDGYRFHPGLLDCILHGGLCCLDIWSEQYVPASIELVTFHAFPTQDLAGQLIVVRADVQERQTGKVTVNVNAYTAEGIHLVEFYRLSMRSVSEELHAREGAPMFSVSVQPKARTTEYATACSAALANVMQYAGEAECAHAVLDAIPDIKRYVATMAQRAKLDSGNRATGTFIECVERLSNCAEHVDNPAQLLRELQNRLPFYEIELRIVEKICNALDDLIVTQSIIGNLIYQPDLLPIFFRESITVRSVYEQTARLVNDIVRPKCAAGAAVRILELGLRTGGLTKHVAPHIADLVQANRLEYIATDLASTFFPDAEEVLADFPWVKIQKFDFEKDITEQGLAACSFDVVLVFSTFHGAKDVDQALSATSQLLVPGGVMINIEPCCPALGFLKELWFGSMDVWWRFTDFRADANYFKKHGREYGTCWLNQSEWVDVFARHGYTDIIDLKDAPIEGFMFNTLVATKGDIPPQYPAIPHPRRALLISDTSVLQNHSSSLFGNLPCMFFDLNEAHTAIIERVQSIPADDLFDSIVIFDIERMRGYTYADAEKLYVIVLETVKALQGYGPGNGSCVLFCTRDVDAALNPFGSFFNGFTRSIATELADNVFIHLDFDGNTSEQQFVETIKTTLQGHNGIENEYVVRNGNLHVKRVHSLPASTESILTDSMFRLENDGSGTTDSVRLCRAAKPVPIGGEVVVRVESAGLNFKDVLLSLNLLDQLETTSLGLGCVGTVDAIGPNVSTDVCRPGDKVVALAADCLATHSICDSQYLVRAPANLAPNQLGCVTIFATVVEALINRAHVQAGEVVLIHSAMSGVGQCAVRLAKALGAVVIATAGSEEKRQYLTSHLGADAVADSRSLGYVDVVREFTHGRGVNVVLNCLSGEHIVASLHLCAPGARFVEIGKKDILSDNSLPTRRFLRNVSFLSCHLDLLLETNPEYIRTLLHQTLEVMSTYSLSILVKEYTLDNAAAAFKEAAKGTSLTKAIFQPQELAHVDLSSLPISTRVHKEATILLVGGFGGVGLELIQSLAQSGAKHILVTSRSSRMSRKAENIVNSVARRFGTRVYSVACDVSRIADVRNVHAKVLQLGIPPVRGIFQLAAVFEDGLIGKLSRQQFLAPIAIKANGLLNLVEVFDVANLDYIVATSSMNDIAGALEQTNYVAANCVMTSLCEQLRARGVHATSVGLGPVLGAGIIEQNPRLAKIMKSRGHTFCSVHKIVRGLMQATVLKFPPLFYLHEAEPVLRMPIDVKGNLRWIHWTRPTKSAALTNLTVETITERIAAVFLMNPADIDPAEPLVRYGVDSLLATELMQCIKHEMGVEINYLDILSGISVNQINEVVQAARA